MPFLRLPFAAFLFHKATYLLIIAFFFPSPASVGIPFLHFLYSHYLN